MGTDRNKDLISYAEIFNAINHKLDLLLQKNEIDPTLECWDDGNRYLVVLDDAPEYYPRDAKGRYIAFGGTIGECTIYLRSCYRHDLKVILAGC